MDCITYSKNAVLDGQIHAGLSKLIDCLENNSLTIQTELVSELRRELLFLKSQFATLDRRINTGLISDDIYFPQQNKILKAIIYLITDLEEAEKKSSSPPNKVRAMVELTINQDFDAYSKDDLTHLSNAIVSLLSATGGNIIINNIREGSVIVQVALLLSQAEELISHIEAGKLDDFNIINSKIEIANNFRGYLGNIYYLLGEQFASMGINEEALELYTRSGKNFKEDFLEKEASNMYQRAGKLAHENNDYDKALELTLESLRIANEADDIEGQGIGFAQLGSLYFDRSDYEKANKYLDVALKIFQDHRLNGHILTSRALIGLIHYRQKSYERALSHFSSMLKLAEEIEDVFNSAYANYLMGSGLIELKLYARARQYNDVALDLYTSLNDQMGESNCLHQAGIILRKEIQFEEAVPFYSKAYEISRSIYKLNPTRTVLEQIASTFAEVGRLNMLAGKYEPSFYFLLKAHNIFNTIGNNPTGLTGGWIEGLKSLLDDETVEYFIFLNKEQNLEDFDFKNPENLFTNLLGAKTVSLTREKVLTENITATSYAIAA